MASRRREPPRAVEEWSVEPVDVAPQGLRCGRRAWYWRTWNTWAGVAHYPSDVTCVRHEGHPGRHASRPRRSRLWHLGRWRALRW